MSQVENENQMDTVIASPYDLSYRYGVVATKKYNAEYGVSEKIGRFISLEKLYNLSIESDGDYTNFFGIKNNVLYVPIDFSENELKEDEVQFDTIEDESEIINEIQPSEEYDGAPYSQTFSPTKLIIEREPSKVPSSYRAGDIRNWAKKVSDECDLDWVETIYTVLENSNWEEVVEQKVEEISDEYTGLVCICGWEDGELIKPAEFNRYYEAIETRFKQKLATTNLSSGSSRNTDTADFITNEKGEVFGTYPSGPFSFWKIKQVEKLPNFDQKKSWQRHPINLSTGAYVQKGEGVFDAFSRNKSELTPENSDYAIMLYSVPFFESTEDTDEWYDNVIKPVLSSDDDIYRKIENSREYAEFFKSSTVKILSVLQYNGQHKNKPLEYGIMTGLPEVYENFSETYAELSKAGFHPKGWWNPNNNGTSVLRLFMDGTFLFDIAGQGAEQHLQSTETKQFKRYIQGYSLHYDSLVESFVQRLLTIDPSGEKRNGDEIDYINLVSSLISKQHLTLATLSESDILETPESLSYFSLNSSNMKTEPTVEEFIESHPVLNEDRTKQASFLLGGLVGRITATQSNSGISRTLLSQHPVESVSKRNIEKITHNVLNQLYTYADSNQADYQHISYGSWNAYKEPLTDLLEQTEPKDWEISDDSVKFQYALGVSFGYHNSGTRVEKTED